MRVLIMKEKAFVKNKDSIPRNLYSWHLGARKEVLWETRNAELETRNFFCMQRQQKSVEREK